MSFEREHDLIAGPASAKIGTSDEARAAFAALVRQFEPYAHEIVFIGGWVHALYLAEVHAKERPVATDDIDVTIPRVLPAEDRPTLLELATAAGFECFSYVEGAAITIFHPGAAASRIDVDLMTEANAKEIVLIDGQRDLRVDGYVGQRMLLEHARFIVAGAALHPSLTRPVRIRVPEIAAYVFQKGLSSETRTNPEKQAKDIVYMFEIIRHETLGPQARAGMPALAARYPAEWDRWRKYLEALAMNRSILRLVARQLLEANTLRGTEDLVIATVIARLRRFASEAVEIEGQTVKAIAVQRTSTPDTRMPSIGETEITALGSILGLVAVNGISTLSALYPRLGVQVGVQLLDQPDGGPRKPIRDFVLQDLSGELRLTEQGNTIGSLIWATRRLPLRSSSMPYYQSVQLVCDLDGARIEGIEDFRNGRTFRPWIELSPTLVTRSGEILQATTRPFGIVISQEDWGQILDGFGYGKHELVEIRFNDSKAPQVANALEYVRAARTELNAGRYDRAGVECGRAVTALLPVLETPGAGFSATTDVRRGELYANVVATLAGLTSLPIPSMRALSRAEAEFIVRATASAVALVGDLSVES